MRTGVSTFPIISAVWGVRLTSVQCHCAGPDHWDLIWCSCLWVRVQWIFSINSHEIYQFRIFQLTFSNSAAKLVESTCLDIPASNLVESDPNFTIPDYSCKNKRSHRNDSVKTAHLCLCLSKQYGSEVSGNQSSHLQRWAPCCIWSECSTLKEGEAEINQDEKCRALTTWNPCWKDMAGVPKFSIGSAWKLHTSLFVESKTVP